MRFEGSSMNSRRRNRRKNKTATVQGLYDMCKAVFAECGPGVVPSQEDVSRLSSYLERMKPEELGLNPNMQYFRHVNSDLPPPVTYLHIYQCPNFSIGIFCLPKSAVIPLHDHPGMTVFSKILFGSMHIKSYDWVLSSQPSDESATVMNGEERLAKVQVDAVFNAPCANSILYPETGGNMHCFTAITACAVLDVLGPPYSTEDDRDCTYYDAFPFSTLSDGTSVPSEDGEYAWLRAKREIPSSFKLEVGEYDGPTITER
ncbi:plant cysteine oxidase 2-like isoform X2 [Carex rostrata]